MDPSTRICVVGLGYVGLPLAVALDHHFTLSGYDASVSRLNELRGGHDRTGEVSDTELRQSRLRLLDDPADLAEHDIFIITVPTPVDDHNAPDLTAVKAATSTVGAALQPGTIVVLESTVYPGVTEDICGPLLEQASGLTCGRDFHLGYSPERVNPGDRTHSLDKITKVVAGQTPAVTGRLADIYGTLNNANIFCARDIRTAEAAKAIENAQRDLNIAFVNEVAAIVHRMDLSIYDVLDAARTKWNFLPFEPGLVGGHCIGVDPYYLAAAAQQVGHHPEIILAGRRFNDAMGGVLAASIAAAMPKARRRVLVLGLTFKENVPDLRNSKVIDLVRGLQSHGHVVDVHDPCALADEAARMYGVSLLPNLDVTETPFDVVVGAVPHDGYRALTADKLAALVVHGGLIADIKGMWRHLSFPDPIRRWQL